MPRRRVDYPRRVVPTAAIEARRRRRVGALGMLALAGLLAGGVTVASYPSVDPTQAIPRLVAREAIAEGEGLIAEVEDRIDGLDLVERDPERAKDLWPPPSALDRAEGAGVPATALEPLGSASTAASTRCTRWRASASWRPSSTWRGIHRRGPGAMVAASDGSLWVLETGRGRVIRVDPLSGTAEAVYRAGQQLDGGVAGDPWLIATAATDVVVVDRDRQAWRADLVERVMRRMPLAGIETWTPDHAPHRAPAPAAARDLQPVRRRRRERWWKWTPPVAIPVTFPDPPESFLTSEPDLDPAVARDLRADANLWLLHRATVTRVNFGTPVPQSDFSSTAAGRRRADALTTPCSTRRLVGDRDQFFVYDAQRPDHRLPARRRRIRPAVAGSPRRRRHRAPRRGPRHRGPVRGDGPPAAYLLTPDRVVRVVLE